MGMFLVPPRIYCGRGALSEAAGYIGGLGKKALVVTDGMMQKLGSVARVTAVLETAGVGVAVFDKVNFEPTDTVIEEGYRIFREENCDYLIAVGGGSPIDAMKGIGILAATGGTALSAYMGRVIGDRTPPMVAVPTTAGTGSEATQFTIVSDTKTEVKMLLKGPGLLPDAAVVDPSFTVTVPPETTAATGVDALTHAVESFTSRRSQPLSEMFALSAVRRIFRFLPRAFREGGDEEAREQMSLAALEAGISFSNSSVTLVHGMSRPIGALFHVPHGISNAMLIVRCLSFAASGAPERFCRLAEEIGAKETGMTDEEGAKAFIGAVEKLCRELSIPSLRAYGIDRDRYFSLIEKMTADAIASGSPANTVRETGAGDIRNIYRALWEDA